ncbi:MAG: RluA family pseudouridine synthase [Desulfobacteraceae bacterium]|nr:RluA family pseudouridine synthase [Desulfobacteraceae bacterium]
MDKKTFFHPLWPVIYQDNHLLVIYKPAGLIMQRGKQEKHNLLDLAKLWIKTWYAKPGKVFTGMVHRLDAPVAGVLVLARTSKAAARLSEQFRNGSVQKTYLAVVQGSPVKNQDRLIHTLVRQGRYSKIQTDPRQGKGQTASLTYTLKESLAGKSLLQINLETGRRHQIRVQLASMGCPILGDTAYGSDAFLPHGRIALLARRLTIIHPTRREPMQFESPIPRGWPWPGRTDDASVLWTIEEYEKEGFLDGHY